MVTIETKQIFLRCRLAGQSYLFMHKYIEPTILAVQRVKATNLAHNEVILSGAGIGFKVNITTLPISAYLTFFAVCVVCAEGHQFPC